jgi:hypothetical protein
MLGWERGGDTPSFVVFCLWRKEKRGRRVNYNEALSLPRENLNLKKEGIFWWCGLLWRSEGRSWIADGRKEGKRRKCFPFYFAESFCGCGCGLWRSEGRRVNYDEVLSLPRENLNRKKEEIVFPFTLPNLFVGVGVGVGVGCGEVREGVGLLMVGDDELFSIEGALVVAKAEADELRGFGVEGDEEGKGEGEGEGEGKGEGEGEGKGEGEGEGKGEGEGEGKGEGEGEEEAEDEEEDEDEEEEEEEEEVEVEEEEEDDDEDKEEEGEEDEEGIELLSGREIS